MPIINHLFQEQKAYLPEDFQRAFLHTAKDGHHVKNIAEQLCSMRVGNKPVLEPVRNDEGLSPGHSAAFRFNYVGLLSVDDCLFLVLPKYYVPFDASRTGDAQSIEKIKSILAAIHRYNNNPKHNDQATAFEYDAYDDENANRLELISFLLNDYADNDLYQSTTHIHEHNGAGEICWPRTINQHLPYPVGDDAYVYLNYESERNIRSNETIIRRIHAAVITEISRHLHQTMLDRILDLPHSEPSNESPEEIGDNDMLMQLLHREMATQFVTRKRLLLQALIRYLEFSSASQKSILLAQGTCSFELVWEDICKKLFNDDESLHPIAPVTWAFNESMDWNGSSADDSIAGRIPDNIDDVPLQWACTTQTSNEENPHNSADLLPDIVTCVDDQVFIIDAKYYVPKYDVDLVKNRIRVSKAPSTKDITKQYFYYFGLAHTIGKTIHGNAFVMPGQIPLSTFTQTSQKLLTLRGIAYLPFMIPLMRSLYGTSIGGIIPIYEIHPECAIQLYLDKNLDSRKLALQQLSLMFK